jgi:hypothetical protein
MQKRYFYTFFITCLLTKLSLLLNICKNVITVNKIMQEKLKQFAIVQMGYSFRSRLEVIESGNVAVIQMKDLSPNNRVVCGGLDRTDMDVVKDHHLAQKGDLVFRSRGRVTTSAILAEDPGRVLVAAPLLRIRITQPERILPDYLNWFISQPEAQRFLASRQEGSSVNMISRAELEDLPVWIPPLEKQHHIVELAALSARESKLLQTLAQKREQYFSTLLMRVAKGTTNGHQ